MRIANKNTEQFSRLLWCSVGVRLGRRHIGPPGLSQSRVSLRGSGMRGRWAANQRRTRLRSSI
uniref:Uncharacterized protein n=1 Tax=Mesocestoides corti TaxID=53468 RepID=A0A5K3FSF0_MESCO